jgi:hypothetical protein
MSRLDICEKEKGEIEMGRVKVGEGFRIVMRGDE